MKEKIVKRQFLKQALFLLLLVVFGVSMAFATGESDEQAAPNEVISGNYSLGTGGQSGIYYPFGGAIADLWSKNIEGLNVKAEVTAASVENTIKVAAGSLLAGFAQANVVEQALKGTGKFSEKLPVVSLMSLYPNLLHIMLPANTDIKSLNDFKGARVSLGAPASGTAVTAENILKANGISVENDIDALYLNYSETTNALANGQIDVGFIVGGLGVGAITELALTKDIIILSLSEKEIGNFIAAQPSYKPIQVSANVYNGVPAFNTTAIWNILVVREDMSVDTAYNLTKIIYENHGRLTQVVKSAEYTLPMNAKALDTIPLHPGTQKYLDEMTN